MEKRSSRYLRYALFNAAKYVCHWNPVFAAYLAKKRAEGKHYNIALSHAAKKLVRLIFAMEKSNHCSQRPVSNIERFTPWGKFTVLKPFQKILHDVVQADFSQPTKTFQHCQRHGSVV